MTLRVVFILHPFEAAGRRHYQSGKKPHQKQSINVKRQEKRLAGDVGHLF